MLGARFALCENDDALDGERSSKMAAMATSSRDAYFKHRSRTRTTNWGDVETYQLIELWQSFRYDLQQTKKRRPIFEQMSRLMHGLGFKRDANEIQGRITNLAYLYRREGKLRLENPLRSPWKFWDSVHKVLRGEPPRRTPIQARQILPKPVSLPNTEARMIPPDTTLTVVNVPLPDVSVVKVEKPSVPESTSAGDGRKSPPDESTAATEAWTDQSAASIVNGEHSEEDEEGSDSYPHASLRFPSECPCDILKTVAEQQRLMALQILNEEEIRHEERVRIVLEMENRLKQEHNNFKLALIDRLNKGFTQILMALKSSTTS
ncbi:uncharacterized protein LOC119379315 [Rhipicephalus sanguineus]|uniref:uncharacterized protein LOC119379315 n=1 Tax=Rhipicephalus sanguineus TaxID=34632 RepID=UPI0018952344|nr:uncharacterized protein LOC119379315 [Rhipicephalus sanguineus]